MKIPRTLHITWLLLLLMTSPAFAQVKIGLLSTQFVLAQKFKLMEQAAKKQGVELVWLQVDNVGEDKVKAALANANLIFIDAPRADDISLIDRVAGNVLHAQQVPSLQISVMNPAASLKPVNIDPEVANKLFDYYAGGTPINYERLFQYLNVMLSGGDVSKVPEPMKLPNGGIYHPQYSELIFDNLPAYLAWWEKQTGKSWQNTPVIGMEISSSYISDGQLRLLNETVAGIEQAGGVPLVFYRSTRVARNDAAKAAPAVPAPPPVATAQAPAPNTAAKKYGKPDGVAGATALKKDKGLTAFPNPKARQVVAIDEPLITLNDKVILNVLMVHTFLGMNPDGRKAWHQAMGIPVINVLSYRTGTRADYYKDLAGVSSFNLPFTLTNAEYIELTHNKMIPFVVSLSNHELPFDKLRANGFIINLYCVSYRYARPCRIVQQ